MKLSVCEIFEHLKTFLKIFVMFGNEDVYEIVLIMSDSTTYQLLKFSFKLHSHVPKFP